jgi:hypothetical protein
VYVGLIHPGAPANFISFMGGNSFNQIIKTNLWDNYSHFYKRSGWPTVTKIPRLLHRAHTSRAKLSSQRLTAPSGSSTAAARECSSAPSTLVEGALGYRHVASAARRTEGRASGGGAAAGASRGCCGQSYAALAVRQQHS